MRPLRQVRLGGVDDPLRGHRVAGRHGGGCQGGEAQEGDGARGILPVAHRTGAEGFGSEGAGDPVPEQTRLLALHDVQDVRLCAPLPELRHQPDLP